MTEGKAHRPCEVSWFSALCDDDYEFLGQPDPMLQSSWEHCRNIVLTAEKGGFDNILLPSGYQLGLDTTVFAAAIAPYLERMRLLMAVRIGEDWPPQLARRIATLDRILGGRLTVNIISSDLPGQALDSEPRYARTVEVMKILKTILSGEHLSHHGEFYDLELDPPRMTTVSGRCPPLYFGGLSPAARDAAAEAADVYLMWPDTMDKVRDVVGDLTARAAAKGRQLKFGYRAHVIVRETVPMPAVCCPSLMRGSAKPSARNRSTPQRRGSRARLNCGLPPGTTDLWRTICGPGSAALAPAAEPRLSVIRTRFLPSCAPIKPRESMRLSSRGIHMLPNAISSHGTSCRNWNMGRC